MQKQVGVLMAQLGKRETELTTLRGAAKADHEQIAELHARLQVISHPVHPDCRLTSDCPLDSTCIGLLSIAHSVGKLRYQLLYCAFSVARFLTRCCSSVSQSTVS